MKKLLIIFAILFFAVSAQSATENYYFADTGKNGSVIGDCQDSGDPCKWVSSHQTGYSSGVTAQDCIDGNGSGDTVNLYFKVDDQWDFDSICGGSTPCTTLIWGLTVTNNDPFVHIDEFGRVGSEDKPKFYGGISQAGTYFDDAGVPVHNQGNDYRSCNTGPCRWSNFIRVYKDGTSTSNRVEIKNIWIDGWYGGGIMIGGIGADANTDGFEGDYTLVQYCKFTELGGIPIAQSNNTHNPSYMELRNNYVYNAGMLFMYDSDGSLNTGHSTDSTVSGYVANSDTPKAGKWNNFSGAFSFNLSNSYGPDQTGNIYSGNVILNMTGEGINFSEGIVEYNVIGDTGSVGIYHSGTWWPKSLKTGIIRYNLVVNSDHTDANSLMDDLDSGGPDGIGLGNENSTINTLNAYSECYGNVVIGKKTGILLMRYGGTAKYDYIKVYNNTVIDSWLANFRGTSNTPTDQLYFYNNASIFYDFGAVTYDDEDHTAGTWPATVTADKNFFYSDSGTHSISADFNNGKITTGDPKLYGQETSGISWGDITPNINPTAEVDFDDLAPQNGSGLIDSGKDLTYDSTFLTAGTDFSVLPDTQTFVFTEQVDGVWDIGAYVLGFTIYDQYPLSAQPCDGASSTDTIGVTSSANANCKYSDESGGDDCDTTFANLDSSFTGGEGTTDHTFSSTVNCSSSKTYIIKCQDTATSSISNCVEVIHSVSPAEGETPQGPPVSIETSGNVNIVGGGAVNIN